jgi:alpha-D-xyloside xylohydrolase
MTLAATNRPDGLIQLDIAVQPPDGVTSVYATFQSNTGEAFHGFGGRRESTNLRGAAFSNWVFDYRFPDLTTSYYDPQPMFVSSSGYSLWLDTDAMARFRMASDADAWRVSVSDGTMRLLVSTRGLQGAAALDNLGGRTRVAPSWSMGPMLSRTVQLFADTPGLYLGKVQDDLQHIGADGLGIEAYAYEGWGELATSDVQQINASLSALHVHPVLYIRSFVANDGAGTQPTDWFTQAMQLGYVAKTSSGAPYTFPSSFDGSPAAVVDFTNPAARAWWQGLVTGMLDLGADGFMSDFGEQVLPDMVFSDGSTGAQMHNRYPVLQHQAAREAIDAYMANHPDREIFFYVRAGYSGMPGAMAYENAEFPGDESCDWSKVTGLPSIVPDMLNRAVLGGYGFTTDIGGYADFRNVLDEELFIRWTEAAVFTTHFRVHNSATVGVKMPWSFSPTTEATWKAMADLHVRARPLITSLWQQAQTSGTPPIRPLWLEHGADRTYVHDDDEWMVGPDLLVAPVVAQGATTREVWFPPGCWQLHGDGASFEGGSTVTVDAPLDTLPWFVRCGATPLP